MQHNIPYIVIVRKVSVNFIMYPYGFYKKFERF